MPQAKDDFGFLNSDLWLKYTQDMWSFYRGVFFRIGVILCLLQAGVSYAQNLPKSQHSYLKKNSIYEYQGPRGRGIALPNGGIILRHKQKFIVSGANETGIEIEYSDQGNKMIKKTLRYQDYKKFIKGNLKPIKLGTDPLMVPKKQKSIPISADVPEPTEEPKIAEPTKQKSIGKGGSQVTELYENNSSVFLTHPMSCRSSKNWMSNADNIIGLMEAGSEGIILDSLKIGKRVIGYQIKFKSGEICWIHAPGVALDGNQSEAIKKKISVQAIRICKTDGLQPVSLKAFRELFPHVLLGKKYNKNSALCKKPYQKCNTSIPRSNALDKSIIDAANAFGIPPALIKSQIAAETSFRYRVNVQEKQVYMAYLANPKKTKISNLYRKYLWGRGLGQFGADTAPKYGLAWYKNKAEIKKLHPEFAKLSDEQFEIKRKSRQFFIPGDVYLGRKLGSVLSDRDSIFAKTQHLKKNMDRTYEITINNSKGDPRKIDVNQVFKMSTTEHHRVAVAAYNRGPGRVQNSVLAFAVNEVKEIEIEGGKKIKAHPVPTSYIDIAFAKPFKGSGKNKYSLLLGHRVGRCHVYKILRICGKAGGFYAAYSKQFKYNQKVGTWSVV